MNNLFDCHARWCCLAISWLHVECWLDCLTFNTRKDLDTSCHPNVTASLRIVSTIFTNPVTTKECERNFLQDSASMHARWNLIKTFRSTGSRNSYHEFKQQFYTTLNFTYFLVKHLKNKSWSIADNKLPEWMELKWRQGQIHFLLNTFQNLLIWSQICLLYLYFINLFHLLRLWAQIASYLIETNVISSKQLSTQPRGKGVKSRSWLLTSM